MQIPAPSSPALVGLDWGTTSLRAYLMDATAAIIDERAEPWGIMHLGESGFAETLGAITAQWPEAAELPAIACGMVGSAQGWVQAPYCTAPAGAAEIANALASVPGTRVHVVPGVAQPVVADVMRGEETQIIGALAAHHALGGDCRVICPGTHSKWVTIDDGRIAAFTTYLTGELYGVLVAHSILGRLAQGMSPAHADVAAEAFLAGVHTSRDSRRDSLALLFSARARVLLGELPPETSLDYLSGVLIGCEVRDGLAAGVAPSALIGDLSLSRRYALALAESGVHDVRLIDHAAPRGLWQVAVAAGLCATTQSHAQAPS